MWSSVNNNKTLLNTHKLYVSDILYRHTLTIRIVESGRQKYEITHKVLHSLHDIQCRENLAYVQMSSLDVSHKIIFHGMKKPGRSNHRNSCIIRPIFLLHVTAYCTVLNKIWRHFRGGLDHLVNCRLAEMYSKLLSLHFVAIAHITLKGCHPLTPIIMLPPFTQDKSILILWILYPSFWLSLW